MSCMEFLTLIGDYIQDKIESEDVLHDFIVHGDSCDECREELELYYTLHKSLLDEEMASDFKADIDDKQREQLYRIGFNRRTRDLAKIAPLLGEAVIFITLLIIAIKAF